MSGVDRTQEDVNQDVRLSNLEQLERELKKILDDRSQRISNLEAVVKPLAELEQRLAWLGSQVDNCRKALAPTVELKGAFEILHTRVNVLEDVIKKIEEFLNQVKHHFGS